MRVEALKWWNSLTSERKVLIKIKHSNSIIGGGVRNVKSLTGFEIEKLYKKEVNNGCDSR